MNAFWWAAVRFELLKNLHIKLCRSVTGMQTTGVTTIQYSSRVLFISHPTQWGRLFYPLQSHVRLQSNTTCNFMTCTLWSPCKPTQMGGTTVGYKTLILSTQSKQDKVHRSDSPHCNANQSSSETLPLFSLQSFHPRRVESQWSKKF